MFEASMSQRAIVAALKAQYGESISRTLLATYKERHWDVRQAPKQGSKAAKEKAVDGRWQGVDGVFPTDRLRPATCGSSPPTTCHLPPAGAGIPAIVPSGHLQVDASAERVIWSWRDQADGSSED
jgi:hypothetical protein